MATIYASAVMTLDSNIDTGGGTDITTILNSTLAGLNAGDTLVLDGYGLISGTINLPEPVNFIGIGDGASGLYLDDNSDCVMVMNSNVSGTVRTTGGGSLGNMVLNGNEANQHKYEQNNVANEFVMGIWLGGVDGFTIEALTIRNAKNFAPLFVYVKNITVRNLRCVWDNPNTGRVDGVKNFDGPHFWGDCENMLFDGVYHNGDDDCIALNTNEGALAPLPSYRPERRPTTSRGDLTNVVIQNVFCERSWNAVRIYSVAGESPRIDGLVLRNFSGACFHSQMVFDDQDGTTTIGAMEIDNWRVGGPGGIVVGNSESLRLNDIMDGTPVDVVTDEESGNYFSTGVVVAQVAQWNLSNLTDSIGQFTLTNHNAVTFAPKLATFNGTNQYLSNPTLGYLTTIRFTVVGWFRRTRSTAEVIIGQWGYLDTVFSARWLVYSNGETLNAGTCNNSDAQVFASTALPEDAETHFFAMQVSEGDFVRVRIDNAEWESAAITGTLKPSKLSVTLGAALDGGGTSGLPTAFLAGDVSRIGTYVGLLTDEQIDAIRDAPPAPSGNAGPARYGDSNNTLFLKWAMLVQAAGAPTIPVNTTPPVVSGPNDPPIEGDVLTCSDGTWSDSPTSFAYQWYFGSEPSAPIEGATSDTLDTTGHVGEILSCAVVASNASGDSTPAFSAFTATVEPLVSPDLIVSGAGREAANGGYLQIGGGGEDKPIYEKIGDSSYSISFNSELSYWTITDGGDLYTSTGGDVGFPWLAPSWEVGSGDAPAPTVTEG